MYGDPATVETGGIMTDSSGELIADSGAIEAIAGAYEQASDELSKIAHKFAAEYGRESFGELPSIEQLRQGYLDLAVASSTSAVVRLQQFTDAAHHIADQVRAGGRALETTDATTSQSLGASIPHDEEMF